MAEHEWLLAAAKSVLLVIDLQESYRDKLHEEARVIRATTRLLDAAGALAIPVLLTEQYPKGLGATRKEIARHLPADCARFEKTSFSALDAPGLRERLQALARPQVVVAGIETHVCVSQTVLGLAAEGFQPHAVRDAITARFPLEDEVGFGKLVGAGAVVGTVESVLFEWLRDSHNPAFKAVQRLVV